MSRYPKKHWGQFTYNATKLNKTYFNCSQTIEITMNNLPQLLPGVFDLLSGVHVSPAAPNHPPKPRGATREWDDELSTWVTNNQLVALRAEYARNRVLSDLERARLARRLRLRGDDYAHGERIITVR
ncbi:hypothetical protein HYALB_00012658 [Hymenoscyphus albidus]|uniref:Uncharacterized protein n=1 Tax=Hymenoscyphus albidus TaxID=595503 RepID=A0A9N9Q1T4_9HELO|nr:hypothetical protein HYALB_00012658 [Hymenoscyphus albidus]